QARFEIVLQPEQHIAVADRRVMLRHQLDLLARGRLQQLAQHRRLANLPTVKRVEDQPLGAIAQPDQEVSGKRQPDALPALCPRGMQIEDDPRPVSRWADRKSTRLNSSHVAISYAVFCL